MRAGVRGQQVRDARRVPPAVDGAPDGDGGPARRAVRLLPADPCPPRRVGEDRQGRVDIRLRAHPADIRLRGQLPHPEVPAGAEHHRAQRLHLHRHHRGPPRAELAGGLPLGMGPARRLPGAQLLLVGHRRRTVPLHRAQPQVQVHLDRIQRAGLHRPAGVPEVSTASAVMLCLETWYFQILVLIAGLLPNPEIALDSLSVCMTISGWVFMISVGFNAAASVRVSNELGAGNPKSASFSVLVVTVLSAVISVIIAAIILSLRNYISYLFTEGETVAVAVSELTPLLAITLILNGIQPVLSGVAVGCGWQAFVAYVNVGCYYFVGVPVGVLLGFKFGLGAKGIWSGMIFGTFMQTVILLWVTFRTDWEKELCTCLKFQVEAAMKRLDKWEGKNKPLLADQ
ncbi:putative protein DETOXIFICATION 40 [Iris pallida]|uniref:Protein DETOXIFICATION n=1 Tax=Iris pallida TaxID=29817 RepID=A0AAX6G293_IRIPA|nr:putative protein DETOXIFICATION 40 [Iris pallida]